MLDDKRWYSGFAGISKLNFLHNSFNCNDQLLMIFLLYIMVKALNLQKNFSIIDR
ncbi:hypothetical protein A1OE_582 [Candidatus Endolissoclinum faulkneri L2]|uniref:Uncharacterized protein n=1 Tax=Candidatus Endolissoclinum faulkneri L2 TaxID=1193729 RepID=K7Z434_9PROT|nr:hypothetical protein A1OE_582 [Candidatus Endolissoclinum faulkneri L2]